jgi:hypothetical protein
MRKNLLKNGNLCYANTYHLVTQAKCLFGRKEGSKSKEKDIDARVKTSQAVGGQNFTNFLQKRKYTTEKKDKNQ